MDTKQIDVMVADASHEVYVDTILDTIREAAKVRGTGIAAVSYTHLTLPTNREVSQNVRTNM